MAISEDTGNQPVAVHDAGASPATTASFSPQAGTLLVAMVGMNGPSGSATAATISDSLAGGWTLLKRQNTSVSMGGTAEVWCRYLSSAPGSMTVTATWTGGDSGANLVVRCLLGASSTQNGATAGNGGASIAPNVAITPTQTGSWVYGALTDWTAATTMVANGITTIIDQFNDGTNGDTYAVMKATASTSSLSPTTYGCTNVNAAFNVAFAEILATATAEAGPIPLFFLPGESPLGGIPPWQGAPDASHDIIVNAGTASAAAITPATKPFLLLALSSESGPGATVQTFNDAAPLPLLFQPDDLTGGVFPWQGAPDAAVAAAATTANAGTATGIGTALGPNVGIGSLPGAAAGTGTAQPPTAALGSLPGTSAGTGAALPPVPGLGALPGPATGTGAAGTSSVAIVTQGTGTATGTGTVGSPVPSLGSVPGTSAGTGAALQPTPGLTLLGTGTAASAGTAQPPTAGLGALSGTAPATGTALSPLSGLGALPGTAPASATAYDAADIAVDGPVAQLGLLFMPDDITGGMPPWQGAEIGIITGDATVVAGTATAVGTGLGPTAALSTTSGTATAAAAGLQPVPGLGIPAGSAAAAGAALSASTALAAGTGMASGTVAAFTETAGITALPGTAPANGTAYNATGVGSGTTTANAGTAAGTGTAIGPTAGLGSLPGTGASTATAFTSGKGIAVLGTGTASATAAALSPSVAFSGTATAGVAAGTGTARSASTGLGAAPVTANAAAIAFQPVSGLAVLVVGAAAATGTAYDIAGVSPQVPIRVRVSGREPTGQSAGREPVSSVSGREPDTAISGEEAGT